jgi:hypothetical protein
MNSKMFFTVESLEKEGMRRESAQLSWGAT